MVPRLAIASWLHCSQQVVSLLQSKLHLLVYGYKGYMDGELSHLPSVLMRDSWIPHSVAVVVASIQNCTTVLGCVYMPAVASASHTSMINRYQVKGLPLLNMNLAPPKNFSQKYASIWQPSEYVVVSLT